jgi:hypothetical protein
VPAARAPTLNQPMSAHTISSPMDGREAPCLRCATAPKRGQLRLLDADLAVDTSVGARADSGVTPNLDASGWPAVETSYSGRIGFWRERSPTIFGCRGGVGPLIVGLDTAILISLRQEMETVTEGAGLVYGPLWSDLSRPGDALRDLVQLWWWRDVRFWVCEIHLADARKPLSADRRIAREAAVRELERDFLERGGFETIVPDHIEVVDQPCALHSVPQPLGAESTTNGHGERRLPKGLRDRQLAQSALEAGCHVFLTTDAGILRCQDALMREGMAVLSPAHLLAELDRSGELDDSPSADTERFPDIAAISRLYAGFADPEHD